jgi:hypothetical protein
VAGTVTDTDDTPLPSTAVYVRQFTYGPDGATRVLVRPDEDGDDGADRVDEAADEFVVTLQRRTDGDYRTVGTDTVAASGLRNYTFPDDAFPDLDVGSGVVGFRLYARTTDGTDGTGASYTLDPVPAAAGDAGTTDYRVRAVKLADPFRGRAGNAAAEVSPGVTDDADVVVPVAVDGPEFAVTDLSAPDAAAPGESITAAATVRNVGGTTATRTVEFRLDLNGDGLLSEVEAVASRRVDLLPRGSERVGLDVTVPEALAGGSYAHGVFALDADGDVDSRATGTLDVGGDPPEGTLEVASLSAPASATVGDVVRVEATVASVGGERVDGAVDFRLDLDGDGRLESSETLGSRTVDLAAGERTGVSFDVDTTGVAPGTYTHGVVTADDERTATIGLAGGTGVVRGTVVDGDDAPVGNATVVVRRGDADVARARTDDGGDYDVRVPATEPGAAYAVVVRHPGFESSRTDDVAVDPGGTARVDVVLSREGGGPTGRTVTVALDGAPNGLGAYNVTVGTPDAPATVASVEGNPDATLEQVESGGVGEPSVTYRALFESFGATTDEVTLLTVEFSEPVARSELSTSVFANDADGDPVPASRVSVTVAGTGNPFPDGVPGVSDVPPTNLDDDPQYEDLDGDGDSDLDDAFALAFGPLQRTDDLSDAQVEAIDFDGDGSVTLNDAFALAFEG